MRKLKEQMRWAENLVSVTNPVLAQSEELYSEKLALEKEWPAIFQAMQDMEPEIRAAYQEFILARECSFDAKRIQDAQKSLRELQWKRDGLKVPHSKRSVEISNLLQLLTKPVIDELTDARPIVGEPLGLLYKEISNLVTKRIFVQVGWEDYENEYGRYKKAVVKNNLTQLEQGKELLEGTIEKIRRQIFNPVSQILDTLDEAQNAYLEIDFTKCTKDEFTMEDFLHILRVEGESPGASETLWPWEIKPRAEETRIFEKEIAVKKKVAKVMGR